MKFSAVLKSTALCATLISSQTFAQYTFVDGALTVTQHSDLHSFFELVAVKAEVHSGSTTTVTEIYDDSFIWSNPTFSQPLTSSTNTGNALTSVQAENSGFDLHRNVATGDFRVSIENFDFDVAHATVFADIHTWEGTYLHQLLLVPHAPFSLTLGLPGEISKTVDADGYFHAAGGLTDLRLTSDWDPNDANFDRGSLGIISRGLGLSGDRATTLAYALGRYEFAEVSFDARFAVPEPSTYALIAVGIVLMVSCAHRSKPRSN